jgi:type III secretion system YscD/HrpQ family protein
MPAHLIAEEGPHRGLILDLEVGDEWTIGRDPDTCDLTIEDGTVSRKHARLTKAADGIYLKNLSKVNPTLVNDEEKTEPVRLKEGDRIQVGNTVFLYSEEAIPDLYSEEAIPDIGIKPPKKGKKKKTAAYDDIFGDLEPAEAEPSPPAPTKPPVEEDEALKLPPAPPKPEMTAYDTIFEDTGGEEEIPFNLISEAPLMLKVIAGPNAGAEIGIEKGKIYTLGKDPHSCDIVFQDLSVSRTHARLEVSADGVIEIEDLGSKNGIAVNGGLITQKKVVLPQDLVSLGTTVFMVIDRDAPQETIYSPVASSHETFDTQESKEEEPKPEIEIVEEKRDWKKEPIPTKYLIIGGSAAAIFLIMFLSFFSLFKSTGLEVAQKEPVSEIKEALAKFTDVQFSYNPGSGKLFLVGHVLTPVDYQELKYRLGQIQFITSIQDNVIIDEGVWKMMNDVINDTAAWRGVSIHSPTAGKFVVTGYVPSLEDAAKLNEYLTANFPYLDRLENNVVIEQSLNTQLQSIIAAQNLGAVTFQLSNGNVVLSGLYNEKMDEEFKKLLKEINGIKGITSVKNFAVATHASRAGIDLSQQYQVTGTSIYDGRGYSAVINGRIYTLGDQIDGLKITSIETSTILLEKDGLKYKIDYTR